MIALGYLSRFEFYLCELYEFMYAFLTRFSYKIKAKKLSYTTLYSRLLI